MASESDSETTPQPNDHGPDFLYGPRLVQDRNVFRLHFDQNDDNATRRQWSEEHKRAAYKLLANDPDTLAAVKRLQDLGDATGWNTVTEKPTRFAEFAAGYIVGGRALNDEAARGGPPSIHRAIRRAFLAEQAFPPWLVRALTNREPATPAEVLFSDDDQPFDLDPIRKGEIVVRFAAGTPARDIRAHVVPLVTKALESLMSAGIAERRRGGLSRLEDDPDTRTLAIQAARLNRWDKLMPTDIARRLQLAGPKEKPYDPRVRQYAERLIAAGDRAMTSDWGADWEARQEEIERIEAERDEAG